MSLLTGHRAYLYDKKELTGMQMGSKFYANSPDLLIPIIS